VNLDIALVVASITLTVLLAAVGVEMANKPPTTPTHRWVYRSIFIVLGGLLVSVTSWQSVRNANEQRNAKADALAEQRKADAQYNQVKGQLDGIGQFLAHPPPVLTREQIAAVARSMVRPDTLAVLTNQQLRDRTLGFAEKLTQLEAKYEKDVEELSRYWTSGKTDPYRNRVGEYDGLRNTMERDFLVFYSVEYADIFQEIVQRLPDTENPLGPGDKKNTATYLWVGGLFSGQISPKAEGQKLIDLVKKIPR